MFLPSGVPQSLYFFIKIYGLFLLTAVVIKYVLRSPESPQAPAPATIETDMRTGAELHEGFAESGSGSLQFIDAATTAKFLLHDEDTYVQGMSKSDLVARKVVCQEAYRLTAYFSARDFTEEQRSLLLKATKEADAFFRRYNGQTTATGKGGVPTAIAIIAYFDAARAAALPWKLMLTTNEYEEGLPHTRADYIFISPATLAESYLDLVETLIHEKIHIYQRRYLREKVYLAQLKEEVYLTEYMVSQMGYKKSKRRSEATCDLRANPDLDDWIYRDPKTNQEQFLCYRSAQPTGISDVIGDPHKEHPFEWIAYEISKRYQPSA
jgi:hypothetical protein